MLERQIVIALHGLYGTDDEYPGQGLVEYILVLSFVSIMVIVALIYFKDQLLVLYSQIGNSIPAT